MLVLLPIAETAVGELVSFSDRRAGGDILGFTQVVKKNEFYRFIVRLINREPLGIFVVSIDKFPELKV